VQAMESAAEPRTDEKALVVWGAALFGAGALLVLLFFEGVLRWPLGWPFFHETGIVIGALLASVGHALLVAGLARRRR
jgi:hypothetical protein